MALLQVIKNAFLTFTEQGSNPATPDAGDQRLFIDNADNHLKRIDENDTVVDIESGAGDATSLQGNAVSANAPNDGDVLTWVNGNNDWEPVAPSSGGDIFGFGTLTQPPALTNWTGINLETYFVTTESNGVIHFACSVESGDQFRGYSRTFPTPVKVTAAFLMYLHANTYDQIGLIVTDGTKIKFMGLNGTGTMWYAHFNTSSSQAGDGTLTAGGAVRGPVLWLQYEEDGSNRYFRASPNGIYWETFLSEAKTTFLTGTALGFGAYTAVAGQNSSPGAIGTLIHWVEG